MLDAAILVGCLIGMCVTLLGTIASTNMGSRACWLAFWVFLIAIVIELVRLTLKT